MTMANTQSNQATSAAKPVVAARKPNEQGTISVQAHMRIYDPKTQKTYVEGRA
jgi:hypothetical protein